MTYEQYHRPVMVSETVGFLVKGAGIYVDGTLGGGGHSFAMLMAMRNAGIEDDSLLIGIDQDRHAICEAEKKLEGFARNTRLVQGNFRDIAAIVGDIGKRELPGGKVRGMLLDLGVSSFQIDTPERGFSYLRSGPLDMRMNPEGAVTAADIVNSYDEQLLSDIIYRYGEEKKSRRIAAALCSWRKERGRISSTGELASIVRQVVRDPGQQIKSLSRVFQALRIVVNDEFGALEEVLKSGSECLDPQGRLAVISYHSLEDREVKQCFRRLAADDWGPKGVGLREPLKAAGFRLVTPKPVVAGGNELARNPRSRSARLRVIEKKECPGGKSEDAH